MTVKDGGDSVRGAKRSPNLTPRWSLRTYLFGPKCREHGERARWIWRCFCYIDAEGNRVEGGTPVGEPCRCRRWGLWMCFWEPHEVSRKGVPL